MSIPRIIALVGRRDEPTDGVADYCYWLSGSLGAYGYHLETVRVNWLELGWRAALAELKEQSKQWRKSWVLLQYTTLAWSRRGFPLRAPDVLAALEESGVHCGVVFHDFGPFIAKGMIGTARKVCHLRVLKLLYEQAEKAIFTVPVDKVSWLPPTHDKAVHIPVGANCPEPPRYVSRDTGDITTVAVYCVTTDHRLAQEVGDIGSAIKCARTITGKIRLVVLGRGSGEAEAALRSEFAGTDVNVETLGLLPPADVSRTLACADVLLFVRGYISSRRGSAIAGIACGLPIVGFEGPDTGWPLTEAGLFLVPEGNREALSGALAKVLSDSDLRQSLRQRSQRAEAEHFSWPAISASLIRALGGALDDRNTNTETQANPAVNVKSYQGAEAKR